MIMKSTVTLSDIAKEANVAVKTASKVFNGDDSVRPYIKDHVLKIANRLNYKPNPIAQALRAKSLKIISVYLPELETPFFGSLFQEIYMEFNDRGFLVVPCKYIDAVNNANNTIYACATVLCTSDKNDLRKLVQKGPVLTINSNKSTLDLASNLSYDFKSCYTEITRKVLDRGLKKIAVYCPHSFKVNNELKFSHIDACLKEAGINFITPESEKYFPELKAVTEFCKAGKIDTVFCSNDVEALIISSELQRHGLQLPQDVLIVGCDGSYVLDYAWTIKCDTSRIAKMAVSLVIDELNDNRKHKMAVYSPEIHAPDF